MKVHLVSYTDDPIGTIVKLWRASKETTPYQEIHRASQYIEDRGPVHSDEDMEIFRAVIRQAIPVSEAVWFSFMLEDVPIAWREQAVRHRIGVRYGDNYGVDIIPEMADTSFWSQSMRLLDMSTFLDDGNVHLPASIEANPDAVDIYRQVLEVIQKGYAMLVEQGIPREDARELIPLGATHRISMTINLRALIGIIGKRSCWILQSGLWGPVIKGMIDCLAQEIDPVFRELVYPPCVSNGAFVGCTFHEENRRRQTGDDPLPLCPLWVTHHSTTPATTKRVQPRNIVERIPEYAELWDQPQLAETWDWNERG